MNVVSGGLPDVASTEELAVQLGNALPESVRGWVILLRGDLGAGKSTLARALLHSLGFEGAVPSPTYTLVEPYEIAGKNIYHIDLYRIADSEELEFLGWSDMQDGLMLIEWPERVDHLVDDADVIVDLAYKDQGRKFEINFVTKRAQPLISGISVDSQDCS